MFEEVLHSLVEYSINVSKPNKESQLTEWEYDCLAALDVFWKLVKEDIQDIITYTQQLGMAQEFNSAHIKLLFEPTTKHFLWHSDYPLQKNDLELRLCISKALKKPMVPINTEQYWVLQNGDDIIAFMMCRTHLDREVHTAGDFSDPV